MRGQASAELLTVVAIMAVLILPLLFITYLNASSSAQSATMSVASAAAAHIASTADSVGYLGEGSSMYADIEMPQGVQRIEIRNSQKVSELIFTVLSPSGQNELVFVSRFRLAATNDDLQKLATSGLHRVKISAKQPDGENAGVVEIRLS